MDLVNKGYSWLYSKISESKFNNYELEGNILTHMEKSDNKICFYLKNESLDIEIIRNILKLNPNIESSNLMEGLFEENGVAYFKIKYNSGKTEVVPEYKLYKQDWFMDKYLTTVEDIDDSLAIRYVKIGTFVDSIFSSMSLIRYNLIETITGDDLSFERAFKKKKNENRSKISI